MAETRELTSDEMRAHKLRSRRLSLHCRKDLSLLKINESATVSCTKEFSHQEIMFYIQAYAMHTQRKWFDLHYDQTSNVVHATRVVRPSFAAPREEDLYEEP